MAGVLGRGAQTYRRDALALAWVGAEAPAGEPLCLLDGSMYEGPSSPAELSAGFARGGERFLASLRGDFALVLYDHRSGDGLVVRDHMGGRGLFWHERNGRLVFGSEIHLLLPLLEHTPEPDPVSIAHVFAPSGQLIDRAFYTGVRRLPMAHLMRFGHPPERYWAPEYRRPVTRSRTAYVDGLRTELTRAVRRRARPGEAVGVQLSGGLDSSTVAGAGSVLSNDRRPRRAYSAVFPDHPSIDESSLIADTCAALELTSTRAVVRSGSVISGAIQYVESTGVPPVSPNLWFWFPLMAQTAADGVDVLLDGEGGDEILGLSPTLIADRLRHGRVLAAVDLVRRIPGGGPHLTRQQIWSFIREWGVKPALPPSAHRLIQRRRRPEDVAFRWVRPEIARLYVETDPSLEWKRLREPRWWSHYAEVVVAGRGVAQGMDHVRRRSAAYGVEMRHPLLDVDLIEFVLTIPPEEHFDSTYSRPLVRDAMAGILPDSVRLRTHKSFFDAMFHDSLAGPDLAAARHLLRDPDARIAPFVDLAALDRALLADPPPPGRRGMWAQELWRAVTTECWLRVIDGGADSLREQLKGLLAPADLTIAAG